MNLALRHALVVVVSVVVMTALEPASGWAAEKEVVSKDLRPEQAKNIRQVSRSLARELLEGLNVRPVEKKGWDKFVEKSLWTIKKLSDKKNPPPIKSDHRKVAVWPFWKDELRISKDFARSVSESVLAELVRGTIPFNQFIARDELQNPDLIDLLEITSSGHRRFVKGTALRRAPRHQLMRNAAIALGNSGRAEAIEPLAQALTGNRYPIVRGHVAWALGELGTEVSLNHLQSALVNEDDDSVCDEIRSAIANIESVNDAD